VADHALVVAQVLDALRLRRVSVAGSSYGAAVALHLAARAPSRVEKLVLLNPLVRPGGRHSLARLLRIAALSPVVRTVLRSPALGEHLLHRVLRRSYADPRSAKKDLAAAYYRLLMRDHGERAFIATLRQWRPDEVAGLPGTIEHETLILWGARDHLLPVREADSLRSAIHRSRLEVLPSCGHFPHEEDPVLVNHLIGEFIGTGATAGRRSQRAEESAPV
jgi:pimeloyl-ACP methyl ester carboxylesterase